MRHLATFLKTAFAVFAVTALLSTQLPARGIYDEPTSPAPYWLIVVDWDDKGNVIKVDDPAPFAAGSFDECRSYGALFNQYVQANAPDRRYVSVCAQVNDFTLEIVIDAIIADYNKFFQPPGQGV